MEQENPRQHIRIKLPAASQKEKVDFDSPVSEKNNFIGAPLAISGSASFMHHHYQTMGSFSPSPTHTFFGYNKSATNPNLQKLSTHVTMGVHDWTPKPPTTKQAKKASALRKSASTKRHKSKADEREKIQRPQTQQAFQQSSSTTNQSLLNPKAKTRLNMMIQFESDNAAPHDHEDLKHTLTQLKVSYNHVVADCTTLRTRNQQLEQMVQSLYADMKAQKYEIQQIYSGKPATTKFLQWSMAADLKRQLRQERAITKALTDELDSIKKDLRQTCQEELTAQIETYQHECQRLRLLLESEMRTRQQNVIALTQNHLNIVQIATEEDKKRMQERLDKLSKELKEANELIERLQKLQDDYQGSKSRSPVAKNDGKRAKKHDEQKARLLKVVRVQKASLKALNEQMSSVSLKVQNYDRVIQRNLELTKQIGEVQRKLISKGLQNLDALDVKTPPAQTGNLNLNFGGQDMFSERASGRQMSSRSQAQRPSSAASRSNLMWLEGKQRSPNLRQGASMVSRKLSGNLLKVPNPITRNKTQIVKSLLLPNFDNDRENSEDLVLDQIELKVADGASVSVSNISSDPNSSIIDLRQQTFDPLDTFELLAQGIEVLKAMIDNKGLPDIQFYNKYQHQLQTLRAQATQEAVLPLKVLIEICSQKLQPTDSLSEQIKNFLTQWTQLGLSEMQACQLIIRDVIPCITSGKIDYKTLYERINSSSISTLDQATLEGDVTPAQPPTQVEDQEQMSYPTVAVGSSASVIINEDEMLDIAEQILKTVAQKITENGWSIYEVFSSPDEIIKIIPLHQGETNIKVLTTANFMGRIHQVGIQNLTEFEVACLLRVLRKPELGDCVRYDEVETLLQNFVVKQPAASQKQSQSEPIELKLQTDQTQQNKVISSSIEVSSAGLLAIVTEDQSKNEEQIQIREEQPSVEKTNETTNLLSKKKQVQKQRSQYSKVLLKPPSGYQPTPKDSNSEQPQIDQRSASRSSSPLETLQMQSKSSKASLLINNYVEQVRNSEEFLKNRSMFAKAIRDVNSQRKSMLAIAEKLQEHGVMEEAQKQASILYSSEKLLVKDARYVLRHQIVSNPLNRIFLMIKEVLSNQPRQQLFERLDARSYNQVIRSKSKSTETVVITQQQFLDCLSQLTKIQLEVHEIKMLQSCLQLTPKFPTIFTLKLVGNLIIEVENKISTIQQ